VAVQLASRQAQLVSGVLAWGVQREQQLVAEVVAVAEVVLLFLVRTWEDLSLRGQDGISDCV
jgi:hypothetical protein